MQHAPFFHRPLVSLISLRLTPLQLHPSEQPFRSAEVGIHCWDVPHSRSPLCPAPAGKGRDTAITYPDFLQGLPDPLTSQGEAAQLSWHKARMSPTPVPRYVQHRQGKEETLPSPTQTSCRAFQTLSHHREKRHSSRGTKLREGCRNQGCRQGAAFKQRDLAGTRRERQGSGSEASNPRGCGCLRRTVGLDDPVGLFQP